MFGRVSRACAAVGAAAAMTLGLPPVAHADSTVVVHGTRFPGVGAQLAYVGCTDLFSRADEVLAPSIGFGPGRAPSGARSLGYDLAGGSAIGSQHVVSSVIGNNIATLSVFAPGGSTGRAVVGYQSPLDRGTSVMWFGVAPVSAPAGQWTTVAATPRAYSWTKYDMTTRAVLEAASGEPVQVGQFVAAHGGDGPGLYAITFGCDGAPFSMDAMRIGSPGRVTTYDLEGLTTALTIRGSAQQVPAGQEVTLRGSLVTSSGAPVPSATVILERFDPGKNRWQNIRVVPAADGSPVAKVQALHTSFYRWRFVDRPLAEGTVSAPFGVVVLNPDGTPTDPTLPTDPETPTPTPTPTDPATPTPTLPVPTTPTPTDTPSDPTQAPSTEDPTPTVEATPPTETQSASDEPTPSSPASDVASATP